MRITPSAWRRSANGSLSPVGIWPMPNNPDQRLQLVGQRHAHADVAARQFVAGKARLVVVLDGEGDVVGQAIMQRVIAAHDALQFGELAHHVGEQVGLGQQRGLVGLQRQRFAAELAGRWRGQSPATRCHALALGAELVVIDHLGQPRARAIPASSCGPGRRRTWRRPGAGAPRARCRRSRRTHRQARCWRRSGTGWSACPPRPAAENISGLPSSSGSGIPAARRGRPPRTGRPAHWGARPAQ